MESKFKQFINDNKSFVVFYLIWFLLHLILVSAGEGDKMFSSYFWPFGKYGIEDYGIKEFIIYLIIPIVIWAIYKLIGKDIKKNIDKN